MKRPYTTQFERLFISCGTIQGDWIMIKFLFKKLGEMLNEFVIKNTNGTK